MKLFINNDKGFSLLELMLGLAIFVVSVASIGHLFVGSRAAAFYNLTKTQALFLAKEGVEEQRALKKIDGIRNLEGSSDSITLGDDTFTRNVTVNFLTRNQAEITSIVDYSYLGNDDQISYSEVLTTWNKPEYSLQFDGTDDYVEIPDLSIVTDSSGDEFTMSAWIKTSGVDDYDGIIQNNTFSGLFACSDGGWSIQSNGDNAGTCASGTVIDDGQWHHIVGVYIEEERYIGYEDGVEVFNVITADTEGANSETGRIGDRVGSDDYFNGSIDDVRVYDRTLSAQEIEDLYSGKNITSGLVAHWPMDENAGCTVFDESSNTNDGSLLPDCAGGNSPSWQFRE